MDSYEREQLQAALFYLQKLAAAESCGTPQPLNGYEKALREQQARARLRLIKSGQQTTASPMRDTLHIDNCINANFGAATKEVNSLPPKYSDGSFTENFRGKQGHYRYKFWLDGKLEYTYGYSKQECWNKRTEKIAGKGKPKKSDKETYAMSDWLLKYYDTFRRSNGAKNVQKENERYITEIKTHFGNAKLDKVTSEQIQEFINTFDGVPNKRRRIAQLIRSAFKKAFALRHIKYNPCEALDAPRHKYKSHPVLQFADQRRILENITMPKYKAFFMLCCCTGLRVGEAINAKIDLEHNVIIVTDEDTRTKTHKREIPFLPELIDKDLLSLIQYKRGVQSYFKNLFNRLDIKAVTHSFRVTFISCCLYLGINPMQIQQWVAHKDMAVTINTYGKLLKNDGTSPILEYLKKLKEHLQL